MIINDKYILTAFRDSGAAHTVMSDQLARAVNLTIRPSDETYRGVSSGRQVVAGIATITFVFKGFESPRLTTDVRIVPENSYLFLLGYDVSGD